jgi:hypothetical protein
VDVLKDCQGDRLEWDDSVEHSERFSQESEDVLQESEDVLEQSEDVL